MKLLLILASEKHYEILCAYLKPLGFEIIRYKHVLKAMDNIDEIDPMGIIVSASDFPRHWKTLLQFVRSERPKETTPIIILRGDSFLLDDTEKAFYLGASGVISEDLHEPMEADRLHRILSRCVPVEERRKAKYHNLDEDDHAEFLFTHPENDRIITGLVKDISKTGLSFKPDEAGLLDDVPLPSEIPNCSLRIGREILSPVCKLVHTGKTISLEFTAFGNFEEELLNDYLERISTREHTDAETT